MWTLALWTDFQNHSRCENLLGLIADYQKNQRKSQMIMELLECVEGREFRLSGLIVGYIKQKHLREDFINDLFLKACEKFKTATIASNPAGYVYRFVKNECINFVKSASQKRTPPKPLEEVVEFEVKAHKHQFSDFPEEDRKQWFEKLQAMLTEKEWEAIWKVYYEGKSYEEASIEMNMKRTPFRGSLYRAVTKLKNKYGEDFWKYVKD